MRTLLDTSNGKGSQAALWPDSARCTLALEYKKKSVFKSFCNSSII